MKLTRFWLPVENQSVPTEFFLRGLGLCYFFQWVNLTPQLSKLFLADGIVPFKTILSQTGVLEGFFSAPSLFWFLSADWFLVMTAIIIAVSGLCIAAGCLSKRLLLLCWIGQLSFSTLSYGTLIHIWDRLLLEVGFLAPFLFVLDSGKPKPLLWAHFLLRLVLFRLLVHTGLDKYLPSGDESWVDLTYLKYFWFTQLTPTQISWTLFQLPEVFHKLCTYLTFLAEIVLPPLVFAPIRFRVGLAILFILFQLGIFLAGNFEIFNLLATFLAVILLDDKTLAFLNSILKFKLLRVSDKPKTSAALPIFTSIAFMVLLFPAHLAHLHESISKKHTIFSDYWVHQYFLETRNSDFLANAYGGYLKMISRLHLVNAYGVFGLKPILRTRILIEGRKNGASKNSDGEWEALPVSQLVASEASLPIISILFHERFDTNLWLLGQGMNFVSLQRHHDLFLSLPDWGHLVCQWLRKKNKQYTAVRFHPQMCRFTNWSEFQNQQKNWWKCFPSNDTFTC